MKNFAKHGKNAIDLKKNVTVNKRRTKITSWYKIMLHLRKKYLKKTLNGKSEIIAIIQVNIEVQQIVFVI